MVVLGFDPGPKNCGWGAIESRGGRIHALGFGVISPSVEEEGGRLALILDEVRGLVRRYKPSLVAVEGMFYRRSYRATERLGKVLGVILAVCGEEGVPVEVIPPPKVKAAVAGWGGADKAALAKAVRLILRLDGRLPQHAIDALAVALCPILAPRPSKIFNERP